MYARVPHSSAPLDDDDYSDMFRDRDEPEAFFPGEPITEPPTRRGNPVRATYLFLFITIAAGACAFNFRTEVEQWTAKIAEVASQLDLRNESALPESESEEAVRPAENTLALAPPPPAVADNSEPLPEVVVTDAPGVDPGSVSSDKKSGSADAYSAPRATLNDPYAKHAEAVGLHPDLSRVLLSRLTAADYRNAAFAIDKALKTVPDDKEFEWPVSKKNGSAIFNVHFVAGGGRDCRRYVVTVTKDRWSTTALPMERCGIKLASREGAKKPSIE